MHPQSSSGQTVCFADLPYILLYAAAYLAGELLQLFEWYGGEGFFYVGCRGGVAEALQRVVVWQGLIG